MRLSAYIHLKNETSSSLESLSLWTRSHAVWIICSFLLCMYVESVSLLSIAALGSFLRLGFIYPIRKLGSFGKKHLANLITIFRLMLLFGLISSAKLIDPLSIGLLSVFLLILDGFDGYFARKYNGQSLWGEYLDKETDALFVLLLIGLLIEMNILPFWLWSVGLIRYVYVIVSAWLKPVVRKEDRWKFGRWVAGILMGAICGAFVLPPYWAAIGMSVVAIMVFISFGRSFYLSIWSNLKRPLE